MKKTLALVTGLQLFTAALSLDVFAAGSELRVPVKGMVCGFCAQGIKKKFGAQEAVQNVDVNLEDHLVTLTFKEGKSLPNEKIADILKDAGYTAELPAGKK